jgi:predicted Rdx family selenoprotein
MTARLQGSYTQDMSRVALPNGTWGQVTVTCNGPTILSASFKPDNASHSVRQDDVMRIAKQTNFCQEQLPKERCEALRFSGDIRCKQYKWY